MTIKEMVQTMKNNGYHTQYSVEWFEEAFTVAQVEKMYLKFMEYVESKRMKYFVNYEFHAIAKGEKKPEPFKKNFRYDHGLSHWKEVDEETYKKVYNIFYNEACSGS